MFVPGIARRSTKLTPWHLNPSQINSFSSSNALSIANTKKGLAPHHTGEKSFEKKSQWILANGYTAGGIVKKVEPEIGVKRASFYPSTFYDNDSQQPLPARTSERLYLKLKEDSEEVMVYL